MRLGVGQGLGLGQGFELGCGLGQGFELGFGLGLGFRFDAVLPPVLVARDGDVRPRAALLRAVDPQVASHHLPGRCRETWADAGRCGQMQGDMGRCREIWADAGRCRAMQGGAGQAVLMWRATTCFGEAEAEAEAEAAAEAQDQAQDQARV